MNETKTNKMNAINSMKTKVNLKPDGNTSDVRQWFNYGFVRFIVALAILAFPVLATAQATVNVGTGIDDLRGGNTASMRLILTDGSVIEANRLLTTRNNGFSGNTNSRGIPLRFTGVTDASQIRAVQIIHDGNPRSGEPFDTYDNWDLRSLKIHWGFSLLYDSARDPRFFDGVVRFSGDFRILEIPLRAGADEADFVITGIIGSPRGLMVTVQNIGNGNGIVRRIACSTFGRTTTLDVADGNLASGASNDFRVSFVPSGRVTCFVAGTNSDGSAETVTTNNVFSRGI